MIAPPAPASFEWRDLAGLPALVCGPLEKIVTHFFTLSSGTYTHYFKLFLPPLDIFYSLIKAVIFAIAVTLIHCYYGYNATGGPAGVGVASGRAIRSSIVTVVVLNLFLSLVFWGAHNTVNIAG